MTESDHHNAKLAMGLAIIAIIVTVGIVVLHKKNATPASVAAIVSEQPLPNVPTPTGPNSAAVADAISMYSQKWVRCNTTGDVYYIDGGKKRHATTVSEGATPIEVSCDIISTIPDGDPLP